MTPSSVGMNPEAPELDQGFWNAVVLHDDLELGAVEDPVLGPDRELARRGSTSPGRRPP